MKKIYLWVSLLALVISGTAFLYQFYSYNSVNANPDYICTKSVTNYPCEITSCWAWDSSTHLRTCTWTKATAVTYYATRTGCAAWYNETSWWGYTTWASWRKTPDRPSNFTSCSITEIDTVAPSWRID
jgi:hypothetical protein